MPYSLHQRTDLLKRLRTEVFDLLVVGGGITGAGIARDAALRGLKVALVERGDFSIGTSSRSTKLIHGGLRYLEMGDVGLVFEAVRERQRLMQLAPHLARPQSFVLPVQAHVKHSVLMLDIGLTIYDVLASFAGVMHHRAVRKKALLRLEPRLRTDGLSGGVRYFDATTNDTRLVLANIRGAVQAGAVAVSRVTFEEPRLHDGKLKGATVRDELSGELMPVATQVVIAAAGPWTDEFMGRWRTAEPMPPLSPSKGVHVVVPRARLPLTHAVTMTSPLDGRVVFALPWPHATVLGTTDTAYDGPLDEPACTWQDAHYLVETANGCLEPEGGALQVSDVIATWAGIRPLVAQSGASVYKTSREHIITTDPRGLVAIAGGKLTTFRVMAEQTVDEALKLLPPARVAELKPCCTERLPLPGATNFSSKLRPLQQVAAELVSAGAEPAWAQHLADNYGSDAPDVRSACQSDPTGMEQVLPDLPWRLGELAWLWREEMALDLVDLCVRRTQLYYSAGDRLAPQAMRLGELVARWSHWPADRARGLADQLLDYIHTHRVAARETADAA